MIKKLKNKQKIQNILHKIKITPAKQNIERIRKFKKNNAENKIKCPKK